MSFEKENIKRLNQIRVINIVFYVIHNLKIALPLLLTPLRAHSCNVFSPDLAENICLSILNKL